MKTIAILAGMFVLFGSSALRANEDDAGKVNVVLFVPAGVKINAGYQQRIDEIVGYAEVFFRRELRRWGHVPAAMPFRL